MSSASWKRQSNHRPRTCAERRADGGLLVASDGADQQQAPDVDADDQVDGHGGPEQHEQGRADLARLDVVQGGHTHVEARVGRRMVLGKPSRHRSRLLVGPGHRRARRKAPDDLQPVASSRGPLVFGSGGRDDIDARRVVGRGWQDADDLVRGPAKGDRRLEHPSGPPEQALPAAVGQHDTLAPRPAVPVA